MPRQFKNGGKLTQEKFNHIKQIQKEGGTPRLAVIASGWSKPTIKRVYEAKDYEDYVRTTKQLQERRKPQQQSTTVATEDSTILAKLDKIQERLDTVISMLERPERVPYNNRVPGFLRKG